MYRETYYLRDHRPTRPAIINNATKIHHHDVSLYPTCVAVNFDQYERTKGDGISTRSFLCLFVLLNAGALQIRRLDAERFRPLRSTCVRRRCKYYFKTWKRAKTSSSSFFPPARWHIPKIIQKAFGEQIYVPALLYLSRYVIRRVFEIQISPSLISHHNSVMI